MILLLNLSINTTNLQDSDPNADLSPATEMADTMRSEGKIYVVVLVIIILFAVFLIYLISTDKKVKKLEKELDIFEQQSKEK